MRKVLYILGQLSDSDAEWMARSGVRRVVPPGTALITEGGARITKLYILLDGFLTIEVARLGKVAEIGSGEIIGEMSFVDTAPPSATVRAEHGCVVLELDCRVLEEKIATDTGFGMRFYRALSIFLANRLRGTVQRMGYGQGGSLADDTPLADELDEMLLDTVSLAGERFDRMLKLLSAAKPE